MELNDIKPADGAKHYKYTKFNLTHETVDHNKQFVKPGQTLKAEVIAVDTAERKIGLSFRGATRAEELADAQGFSGGVPTATLGDVMRDKLAGLTVKGSDKKAKDKDEDKGGDDEGADE